jgi:hypothetical protein
MEVRKRLAFLAGLILVGLVALQARADKKLVKFTNEWKGSVADETLQKEAKEFITSSKEFKKLWEAWKIEGKVPEIDFKKEMVVVATTKGSRLNLSANLDDKGDLSVVGLATMDLVPGFRYVIASVSRQGVKTVNKKELPKE